MRRILASCISAALFIAVPAAAETYAVTVTRKDANFYSVDGTQLYLKTKFCYEYSYGAKAVVDTDMMQLTFVPPYSGGITTSCQIEMILSKTR